MTEALDACAPAHPYPNIVITHSLWNTLLSSYMVEIKTLPPPDSTVSKASLAEPSLFFVLWPLVY